MRSSLVRTHHGRGGLGVDDRPSQRRITIRSNGRERHAFVGLGIVHEGDSRTARNPKQHPQRDGGTA